MILYHFTAREYLCDIARHGLWKGEVAVTARQADCLNAVWLTTDKSSGEHGLTGARLLTDEEKRLAGIPLDQDAAFPNKRAIRFKIIIPQSDRNLVYWPKWGKKRLAPEWYKVLSETGGHKEKTWWLYWGTIPAESLAEATDLEAGTPLEGWPNQWSA